MKTVLIMVEVKNEEKLEELYNKLEDSMIEVNKDINVTAYQTYNTNEIVPDIMKREDNDIMKNIKTYFENLKKSKDFDRIIKYIPFEDLQKIENRINQYETSIQQENSEEFHSIEINWWEGLYDTDDFIKFYMDILNNYNGKGYDVIYPSFNESLSGDNEYEIRVYNPITTLDKLYYANDGFCKEFETLDEAFVYIENISNKNN